MMARWVSGPSAPFCIRHPPSLLRWRTISLRTRRSGMTRTASRLPLPSANAVRPAAAAIVGEFLLDRRSAETEYSRHDQLRPSDREER